MSMGEFTNAGAEEAMEKLKEMFNAIPPADRAGYVHPFSVVGTFIQAAQRNMPSNKRSLADG